MKGAGSRHICRLKRVTTANEFPPHVKPTKGLHVLRIVSARFHVPSTAMHKPQIGTAPQTLGVASVVHVCFGLATLGLSRSKRYVPVLVITGFVVCAVFVVCVVPAHGCILGVAFVVIYLNVARPDRRKRCASACCLQANFLGSETNSSESLVMMARYDDLDNAKETGRKSGNRTRRTVANLVGKFCDAVFHTGH